MTRQTVVPNEGQEETNRPLAHGMTFPQSRKHTRIRMSTPFPCSFTRVGLNKWLAVERDGLGVVYDVSGSGARLMTEAGITPGDQIAISLRLPRQAASLFVELATVRWEKNQTYGVEFDDLSPVADMRLRKFLARLSSAC